MIVAAGAGHGHAQNASRQDIDPIIHDIMGVVNEMIPDGKKTHGSKGPAVRTQIQLIRSQLLNNETVDRQILVEGPHHVIAIGIGPRIGFLLKENVALIVRVTRDVQPMASPTFAIVRRPE